jgi:uncharacterized membrane-anchored protein
MTSQTQRHVTVGTVLSKVPEVTIYFWIIKILATTIGETAADYLSDNLGFGSTGTTWVMAALLVAVLYFQFRAPRYIPPIYWLVVVVLSIVGTLVTDNLTDKYHLALETSTAIFAVALAVTFMAGTGSSERCPSTASTHHVVRPSIGSRSSSPSRSAPRRAISSRNATTWATGRPRCCSVRPSA